MITTALPPARLLREGGLEDPGHASSSLAVERSLAGYPWCLRGRGGMGSGQRQGFALRNP
jgi:hypothetical protein